MAKCPLCDKEYDNGRQLHAHMLKMHQAEYKKAGNRVANMVVSDDDAKHKELRPIGFRPLNKGKELELMAYNQGYRYICDDDVFTSAECREKGWI